MINTKEVFSLIGEYLFFFFILVGISFFYFFVPTPLTSFFYFIFILTFFSTFFAGMFTLFFSNYSLDSYSKIIQIFYLANYASFLIIYFDSWFYFLPSTAGIYFGSFICNYFLFTRASTEIKREIAQYFLFFYGPNKKIKKLDILGYYKEILFLFCYYVIGLTVYRITGSHRNFFVTLLFLIGSFSILLAGLSYFEFKRKKILSEIPEEEKFVFPEYIKLLSYHLLYLCAIFALSLLIENRYK